MSGEGGQFGARRGRPARAGTLVTSGTTGRSRGRARLVAAIAGLSLVTACASGPGGSGGSAGGEGLPADATKEEFVAALADMDEITLTTQSAATPGKSASVATEMYKEAVQEWSGGKIKIEITYSNGIVPFQESITAIADGLMDFGYIVPLYEPSRYPASNALITSSSIARPTPLVGTLQTTAMLSEATYASPDIVKELESSGVKLMIPAMPSDSAALSCTSERARLDQLKGARTRVASEVHSQQSEALGMSPVSLAHAETYEALQRGTVDCVLSLLLAADLLGILTEAPHVAIDAEAGFATSTSPIAFSQARWEELPLAAQQLLFDKGRIVLEEMIHVLFESNKSALETVAKSGGGVTGFDADARAALQAKNDKLMEQVSASDGLSDGDAFVKTTTDSAGKWLEIITEDLGYEDVSYADFGKWYQRDKVDLTAYLDRMWNDVMQPQRPS